MRIFTVNSCMESAFLKENIMQCRAGASVNEISEAAHLMEQDNSGSLTHWPSQDFLILLHMKCLYRCELCHTFHHGIALV